jgi:hypothetical protein
MTASEHLKAGKVEVVYIKTHTNHQPGLKEVKYVPLPEATRQEIRNKYADGIKLLMVHGLIIICSILAVYF